MPLPKSTFFPVRSDSGKRTYINTTSRITAGDELKHWNGEAGLRGRGMTHLPWPAALASPSSFALTPPLGGIAKQGVGYLRRLLVVGATAVTRMACEDAVRQPWLARLLEPKPVKIATVALANKTARVAWAMMTRNEVCAATPA